MAVSSLSSAGQSSPSYEVTLTPEQESAVAEGILAVEFAPFAPASDTEDAEFNSDHAAHVLLSTWAPSSVKARLLAQWEADLTARLEDADGETVSGLGYIEILKNVILKDPNPAIRERAFAQLYRVEDLLDMEPDECAASLRAFFEIATSHGDGEMAARAFNATLYYLEQYSPFSESRDEFLFTSDLSDFVSLCDDPRMAVSFGRWYADNLLGEDQNVDAAVAELLSAKFDEFTNLSLPAAALITILQEIQESLEGE